MPTYDQRPRTALANSITPPLPLSVSLIAHNEAANLPRCLRSVAGWSAEIVVVINNCTDDTAAIARSFGARVIENPWRDFQTQKNFSLATCTQPWVLALDADEEVSPALRDEIGAFFNRGEQQRFAAADFPRKSWFLGRWITHGDWYPDRCLRLFRREAGRWGGDVAHTHIVIDAGQIARLRADLHHYSYATLPSQLFKISRQSDDFLRAQIARGRGWSLGAALLRPPWRFFRAYILRLGFLDGFPGFYIAVSTAFSALLRYSRLYEHAHREVAPPVSAPESRHA
jgi:glycosyltransferase involved in cell wall biosynthesis